MTTNNPEILVSIRNVVKHFDISGGWLEQIKFDNGRITRKQSIVKAVNGISFDIKKGQTVSVVGESGCGKSTLARTVMGLYPPNSGEILYQGKRIDNLSDAKLKHYRTRMQMVFQDPYASLNPRMTVGKTLREPIRFHRPELKEGQVAEKVAEVMAKVGIDPDWQDRFPHEFSGGQRQRISIARALALDPDFIVADEPIAALDVSIQAQILNLMMDLQEKSDLTYLFISHDLSVVEHISDVVAVMYLGSLCEMAPKKQLFDNPAHPYTQALLSAIPKLGHEFSHEKLKGDIPSPINLPAGCVFHTRCKYVNDRCRSEIPAQRAGDGNTIVACHAVEEKRI
ncbi:ABC transporter ATP-binding protein [Desulforhopalus singaporensis]|uniref:Peptide/nickel transport system ATP-binding protein n=1 Tax=Desulforhopalus singaporensis TaxID=91360 RepID=A0A1H0TI12_9BACT|nr:dipeptide ABC transporter ATP-binding protein [Desulforhopalus singaporensis]SDP53702.1 peptide/nickel transport system ATP-binding protein [Desulforhopalus singaporensis]